MPEHIKAKSPEQMLRLKGHVRATLRDAVSGEVLKVVEVDNIITTVGKNLLADALASSPPTDDPYINYVAIGTNSTTPAVGDTQLGTENARVVTPSHTAAAGVAYISGFFPAGTGTGTIREAGLFADGTASANSGVLFSHVALNIVKAATNTLTIDWTITIS